MKTAIFFLILLAGSPGGRISPAAYQPVSGHSAATAGKYQCTPCGYPCDQEEVSGPGKCQHCQMDFVKKSTVIFKTIRPEDICRYISSHPGVVLLDVRTREEFEGSASPDFGTLKNAINLPVQELEAKRSSLSALKNREIIVYCSHSHRSPLASYILTQHGFTNIANMAGGMSAMTDNSCRKK